MKALVQLPHLKVIRDEEEEPLLQKRCFSADWLPQVEEESEGQQQSISYTINRADK